MLENAGTEGQGAEASWYYQQPVEGQEGSGIAGTGDVPEWFKVDKYKSIDEQAQAYGELEKRFGGFESAPEEYALPEGLDAEQMDDGMLDILKASGKEYHMSQKMYNDLVSKVSTYQLEQMESNKTQAMENLGADAQDRIQNVENWMNTNMDKDMILKTQAVALSSDAIEVMEFFIDKSKGSNPANQGQQAPSKLSQAEYAEMIMAKDSSGQLKMSTDVQYKKKMDELTLQMQ